MFNLVKLILFVVFTDIFGLISTILFCFVFNKLFLCFYFPPFLFSVGVLKFSVFSSFLFFNGTPTILICNLLNIFLFLNFHSVIISDLQKVAKIVRIIPAYPSSSSSNNHSKIIKTRASLVVQWLRICLLMQGTRV